MPVEFKIPTKPTIKLVDPEGSIERDLRKAGISPPPPRKRKGEPQENFPENLPRRRRRRDQELSKLSLKPPHTKFAVIPSRAITDPRINTRKPLLLLLGAIGIHASVHGICYPSQRRLAMLCGTPTPATMRVVQIEPGPIPTLTASAPASTKAKAAAPVAILPPITSMCG